VQVGEEDAAALTVKEPGKRHADGIHRTSLTGETCDAVENGGDTFLRSGRLGAPLHDPIVVEHDTLDVRSAYIDAEPSHRTVQPPSTVRTAPVTKGAVAR
jgi:hypothetical protein